MSKTLAKPESRLPDWPFVLYLLTGLGGLIFMAGEVASRLGWLEKATTFIFGDAAKSILENIYGIKILLPFLLVPAFPLILILAVFIVVRYWGWWQLVCPAAVLLLTVSIFFGGVVLIGYQEEGLGTALLILSGLYFFSASFVGLRWLIKNNLRMGQVLRSSNLPQLFGKIDNLEAAISAIKGCATAIYILAGINLIFSSSFLELLIWVLLGWNLNRFKSRFVAVLLLVLSSVYFIILLFVNHISFLALFTSLPALLLILVSCRSIQSTLKYHSFVQSADGN